MRTNIVIDDKLMAEALKYSHASTKKELVNAALKEYVDNHKQMDLRKLRGKISFHPSYNYKSMRASKTL
jgi:Arc/MetJ family transcription regulator